MTSGTVVEVQKNLQQEALLVPVYFDDKWLQMNTVKSLSTAAKKDFNNLDRFHVFYLDP